MCRFVAYLGEPILVEDILIKPTNSLVSQSLKARESDMTVNGDGFGLGWYNKNLREEPGIYVSVLPAWNDINLLNNASFIKTSCFLAHVRAATNGGVSLENCHPFKYKDLLMMHNGGIHEFDAIKYDFISLLDEEAFKWIKGQSDTQYIFALFMTNFNKLAIEKPASPEDLVSCFNKTFRDIESLKESKGLNGTSNYNIVLSNGHGMIATRYSTCPELDNRTLHFTEQITCSVTKEGEFAIEKEHCERSAALISSEILGDDDQLWKEIPYNHAVYIGRDMQVSLHKLEDVKKVIIE